MNNLKFRAWHKQVKIMIPHEQIMQLCSGKYLHCVNNEDAQVKDINHMPEDKILFQKLHGNPFENKDLIIMLFLGLLDIDNQEIYEGDFVKHPGGAIMLITYEILQGNSIINSRSGFYFKFNGGISIVDTIHNTKIIGNMYDNPNFLIN